MTNRNLLSVLLIACIVALVSYGISNAVYSKRSLCGFSQPGPGLASITTYLNLTPEQKKQIAPIEQRFQKNQQAVCADMQDARTKLLTVLNKPNPSKSEVDAALGGVAKAQAGLQRQTAEYLLDIKPILTQKQRNKLFDLVGQRFCMQGRCGAALCPAGSVPGCNGHPGCVR